MKMELTISEFVRQLGLKGKTIMLTEVIVICSGRRWNI